MPTSTQYQAALAACMEVQPTVDYTLPKDASQLVDVYVDMDYKRQKDRPLEELTPKQFAAYNRWKTSN